MPDKTIKKGARRGWKGESLREQNRAKLDRIRADGGGHESPKIKPTNIPIPPPKPDSAPRW